MPLITRSRLGLCLNFCPKKPHPTNIINKVIVRFRKEVTRLTFSKNKLPEGRKKIHYISTLNIKSDM